MAGETNLHTLLKNMTPLLNEGEYVYCTFTDLNTIDIKDVLGIFRETEAVTVILKKELADQLGLQYEYIAAWITLTIHSSLAATGLTAAFANALAAEGISCNVIAAYYHDHIFVARDDAQRAIAALKQLAGQ
jgi:hypothetical protein